MQSRITTAVVAVGAKEVADWGGSTGMRFCSRGPVVMANALGSRLPGDLASLEKPIHDHLDFQPIEHNANG